MLYHNNNSKYIRNTNLNCNYIDLKSKSTKSKDREYIVLHIETNTNNMIRSIKWRQLFNIRQLSLLPSSSRRLSSFAKHAEKYETISVSVDEEGDAKILMNRPDIMNAMN